MDKTAQIIDQLRKDARKYHDQFELLDYIEVKGLRNLLAPFIEEMAAENKELKAKHDRVCIECGYGCHVLDIPFMDGECPSCCSFGWKTVTHTERLESDLKNAREGAKELYAKLDKVMKSHNKSIDLQLKIYEDLKTKYDRSKQSAEAMMVHYQTYKAIYEEIINSFGQTDSNMKAKFIGEYSWNDELEAYGIDGMEDGETYLEKRVVPWTLQKEIFRDMSEYIKGKK